MVMCREKITLSSKKSPNEISVVLFNDVLVKQDTLHQVKKGQDAHVFIHSYIYTTVSFVIKVYPAMISMNNYSNKKMFRFG